MADLLDHDRESLLAKIAALKLEHKKLSTQAAQRDAKNKELQLINGQPLPPMARFFGASSDLMGSSEHPSNSKRKISMLHVSEDTPFGFSSDGSHFVDAPRRTTHSTLRIKHKSVFPEPLLWSNKADVQSYVMALLEDVLCAAGLCPKVQLNRQTQISEFRPDIWVLSQHGQPLGVVEVKAPVSDHALKDKTLPQRGDSLASTAMTSAASATAVSMPSRAKRLFTVSRARTD